MKKYISISLLIFISYGCSCRLDPRDDCSRTEIIRFTILDKNSNEPLIGRNKKYNPDTLSKLNGILFFSFHTAVGSDSNNILINISDGFTNLILTKDDTDTIEYKIRLETFTMDRGERCERSYSCKIPYEFKYNGKIANVDSLIMTYDEPIIILYK